MALAATTPGHCVSTGCQAHGIGHFTYWANKAYETEELTGTVVVVQVINTVLNTTRVSTLTDQVPPGFKPPPTNAGGTRTANVTYARQGSVLTTTIAYPTPFLHLPDNYTIIGDYQLADASPSDKKNATFKCVINANQTYNIPNNLQPAWQLDDPKWNLSRYLDEKDPLGWGYSFMETSNWTSDNPIKDLIDVLPDDNPDMPHSIVKGCQPDNPPQPYVITYNPNWRVVGSTSIVYEGGEGSSTSMKPTDGAGQLAGNGQAQIELSTAVPRLSTLPAVKGSGSGSVATEPGAAKFTAGSDNTGSSSIPSSVRLKPPAASLDSPGSATTRIAVAQSLGAITAKIHWPVLGMGFWLCCTFVQGVVMP